MAYTTIDNPELYFQCKIYGFTTNAQSITFDNTDTSMQPDMVWIKSRSNAGYNHVIHDSVRGVTKVIRPNLNNDEDTYSDSLTSFNSNGFTLGGDGSNGEVNDHNQSQNYASWSWKAGTSFSNDASSTGVGSIDSSGSVSTTAGFSIISWTGSGSGATIAHGLGAQPQIVFVKNRDDNASWNVYTVIGGGGKGLFLNENNGFDTDSSYFNGGTASTTTFPVGTANTANGSSDNMIAYCFANVKGYSKIGSYTGNGNADGAFFYTGFRPSFVLIKNTEASEHWRIYDNKRDTFNHMYHVIYGNDGGAESTTDNASEEIDFLANGVKIRSSAQQLNSQGHVYVYLAFAENPFVTSTGIPALAR